jgi:hypothetical protein
MATAFKCDICGWFFEKNIYKLTLTNESSLLSGLTSEVYDVCPKCVERFHNNFVNYIREQNSKKEQGAYDPSSRKFIPYEEKSEKSEETKTKEEPKPTKEIRKTCRGCRFLDDVRITGKGYQCQCITNGRTFTEPSKTRCECYERKG